METPSSTTRITRSQARAKALATLNTSKNSESKDSNLPSSRKVEVESESAFSKSRTRSSKQQQHQQDRSSLSDITNDSPIVGLAMASLETPSSAIAKQKSNRAKAALAPGSGEALLRGQVKTLLQRVEEETSITPFPAIEEQLKICQVAADIFDESKPENLESQKSLNRSLLLDFSEKSDSSDCSSVVTDQGGGLGGGSVCKDKSSTDDDNASVWSIRVNTSSTHDDEEEEMIEQEEDGDVYYHDDDDEEEEGEDDGGLLDALCQEISKINVNGKTMPKFTGKHTRFVYNSDDDEIVDKYEEGEDKSVGVSPSALGLKGLPTPKGKHLRFPLEGNN